MMRAPAGRTALTVLLAVALVAVVAPLLPLADPDATAPAARLRPVLTAGHPLGTDHLGRDMLARLVWGGRLSLALAVAAAVLSGLTGSLIGLVAALRGGWLDTVLMRGIDVVMAFPYLLLALAIVAILGPGLFNVLIAVSLVNVPFFARIVRGAALAEAARDYVRAARALGLSEARIAFRHVLPNVLPAIIVALATTTGWMIVETAGLSFLGLGAQPPQADLGSMLGEGRKVYIVAPHVAVVPGLAIMALVIAANLAADALRDVLDPRRRMAPAPAG